MLRLVWNTDREEPKRFTENPAQVKQQPDCTQAVMMRRLGTGVCDWEWMGS